jgi:lipooligosaccharide transport system ATP-binding protein
MKRRLVIARALINDPELLLLDEPTTGLDPQVRQLVWERLYSLKERGIGLILTTHYMDEAEQLCDHLVVMNDARIVAAGTPRQLIDRYSSREVVELRFSREPDGELGGIGAHVERRGDRLLLYADDGDAAAAEVYRRGLQPQSLLVRRGSLEDVFLHLTGRQLVE